MNEFEKYLPQGVADENPFAKYVKSEEANPFAKYLTQAKKPDYTDPSGWGDLTTKDILMQEVKSFNDLAVGLPDLFLPGTPFKDAKSWLHEKITGQPEQDYLQPGMAKDIADSVGMAANMGLGFIPVTRAAGGTSSVMADLLGFGNTAADDTARMVEQTGTALANSDAFKLKPKVLQTSEDVLNEVSGVTDDLVRDVQRSKLDEYTNTLLGAIKGKKPNISKDERQWVKETIAKGEVPRAQAFLQSKGLLASTKLPDLSLGGKQMDELSDQAILQVSETYGKSVDEINAAIREQGGMKVKPWADNAFAQPEKFLRHPDEPPPLSSWDKYTLPITDVLRKYVDEKVGARFARASETATRFESILPKILIEPNKKVLDFTSKNRTIKRHLMDIHKDPENLSKARFLIHQELGPDGLKQFDDFVAKSQQFNGRIQKTLFKEDPKIKLDDVFFHTEKETRGGWKSLVESIPRIGKSDTKKPSSLKNRTRKSAFDMTDAEVDQYMNPLLSQAKHISDMEHLIQIADTYKIRPALKTNSTVDDMWKEVSREFRRRGMDKERADATKKFMNHYYMGMSTAPNAVVRAVLSLGYAGTLAQLKSAVLNLSDVTVSMVNQGVLPTMKAMISSTKGTLGKSLKDLGLDRSQNVGEFQRHFDSLTSDPGKLEKFARASHKTTDISMLMSGFQGMDRVGKGVVLRAAVVQARNAAKNGTLLKEFGDVMTKGELERIRPWLAKGTKPQDMPAGVRDKIEQLAFTALGKQQLITAAGRPVAYLDNATLRPAYAMAGFALKHLTLLRRNIIGEMKKGNAKEAAAYAAKYVAFAGLGTSLLNESRQAAFTDKEFEAEDILVGVLEQIAAVSTMNKIGDPYALQQLEGNMVGFILESFIPPMGLVEAAGQTAGGVSVRSCNLFSRTCCRKSTVIVAFVRQCPAVTPCRGSPSPAGPAA